MTVQVFRNDESSYLSWIEKHSHGFVVNTRRKLDPKYLVLHRASCRTILRHRNMECGPGGFTEREYQKICALSVGELQNYVTNVVGTRVTFSKLCSICQPKLQGT